MRKNISTYIVLMLMLVGSLFSCQKNDLPLDGSTSKERAVALQNDIKAKLHDKTDGWVLMIKNSNSSVKTAIPVIFKFDTLTSTVKTTSLFAKDQESKFLLSASTGAPLLSFSTQSFISAIYTGANTPVTDFFFKILEVTNDSITMQPFRKGNIYQSEGGTTMKLYKAKQLSWMADWLNPATENLYNSTSLLGFYLQIRLKPTFAADSIKNETAIVKHSAGNYNFFRASYPLTITYPNVEPLMMYYHPAYPSRTGALTPAAFLGVNSIYYEVANGFTPASYFTTGPQGLMNAVNTNYFLIKSVTGSAIEVFAVNEFGKICLTGTIGL